MAVATSAIEEFLEQGNKRDLVRHHQRREHQAATFHGHYDTPRGIKS